MNYELRAALDDLLNADEREQQRALLVKLRIAREEEAAVREELLRKAARKNALDKLSKEPGASAQDHDQPHSSDAALGAAIREQRRDFAKRKAEEQRALIETEHERWRKAGAEIQAARLKPASLHSLAKLVKQKLALTNSFETIRKVLAKNG